jgi:methyltransferase-like protein/2-polyprenyl-3-methyl-5-hydroxy-6-metoxy-1,4-benzoquinol methylase
MRKNSYDLVPYPTQSHPAAHVRRLEAVATLFGMQPRPLADCRVLELGCAAGLNLIPQSLELSQSDFVGVELSQRQVDQGQSIIATLGLDNIELRQGDLLDIDTSWGQFDYILAHGVYSWVPENVREKLLSICKKVLSPTGVAMVSYNVLPGWHCCGALREMMTYHVSKSAAPKEQISQARDIVRFMTEHFLADTAYGQVMRQELEFISNADDNYLYHEHLEDNNHPVYFHDFIEGAEADGLQFLADTDVASMFSMHLPAEARNALGALPLVKQQQYMDFLTNRKFRSTLLCHQGVPVTRNIGPEVLRKFQLSLSTRPEPFQPSFDSKKPLTFRLGRGQIATDSPLGMAVMEHLSKQWPRSITLDELHAASIQRLANLGKRDESFDHLSIDDTAQTMIEIFVSGFVNYSVHPPPVANLVSNRPLATPLARLQAAAGMSVTNQRHENLNLDEFSRFLVTLLDSQHDHKQLLKKIQAAVATGELTVPQDGQKHRRVDQAHLNSLLSNTLVGLCNISLLKA